MFNRWNFISLPEPRLPEVGANLRIPIWITGGLMLGLVIGLAIVFLGV